MIIPADVLKRLDLGIGATLELQVADGAFAVQPVQPAGQRRYALAELLRGAARRGAALEAMAEF